VTHRGAPSSTHRRALADWGLGGDQIEALMSAGVIAE